MSMKKILFYRIVVDNTTIETTDEHGKVQRWDILSGKVVG